MIGPVQNPKFGRWLLDLLLCTLALPALGSGVRAQEEQISVQAAVDKDTITIGDVITYELTITHPPEVLIEPPQLGANLGPFEIRDRQVLPEEKLEDGRLRSQIQYVISIFAIGDHQIPPVEITCIDPDGQTATVGSQKIPIAVESLNPDAAGDIRDIKPPVSLPGTWTLLYWLVGGFILAAVGTVLFLYLRKRRLSRALQTIEYQGPPRPAHEIALEELEHIASLNLIQRGLIKQFYTAISEVIKRYIARRYRIQTMELTTTELMAIMKKSSVPEEHIGAYRPFFQEGDLVKFAKHIPTQGRMKGALNGARQLVLSTRKEPVSTLPETDLSPAPQTTLAESGSGEK